MTVVKPPEHRARIEDRGYELAVTIPPARGFGAGCVVLFLSGWLVGWAAGEFFAASTLYKMLGPSAPASGGKPEVFGAVFLGVWLLGWTVGGIFAVFTIAAALFGTEEITVSSDRLIIRRRPLPRAKEYLLADIGNLRVRQAIAQSQGTNTTWASPMGSAVVFDYGSGTVAFGGGLNETEAQEIVDAITNLFGGMMRNAEEDTGKSST